MKFPSFNNFSIRKCLFLVKDIANGSVFFTQYHKPEVRPLKIFYNGFDVTQLLTTSTHLSNYSYFFLANPAQRFGFTVQEVKTFFKIQRKSHKLLVSKGLTKPTAKDKRSGLGTTDDTSSKSGVAFVYGGSFQQGDVHNSQSGEHDCGSAPEFSLSFGQATRLLRGAPQDEGVSAPPSFSDTLVRERLKKPQNIRLVLNYYAQKLLPALRVAPSSFELEAAVTSQFDLETLPNNISAVYPKLRDPDVLNHLLGQLASYYGSIGQSDTTTAMTVPDHISRNMTFELFFGIKIVPEEPKVDRKRKAAVALAWSEYVDCLPK